MKIYDIKVYVAFQCIFKICTPPPYKLPANNLSYTVLYWTNELLMFTKPHMPHSLPPPPPPNLPSQPYPLLMPH